MKTHRIVALTSLTALVVAACTLPQANPATPTAPATATSQPTTIASQTFTAIPAPTQTTAPPSPTQTTAPPPPAPTQTTAPSSGGTPLCADSRAQTIIASLTSAVQNKDGTLLSSLVSPTHGMDVRYLRDQKVVNYDVEHAKFVFETTFQANWGLGFGSGQPVMGSFQELIAPSLKQVLSSNPQLTCDQLKTGGTTYQATWPYPNLHFYSAYYAGTAPNGNLDWQSWAIGMEDVAGKLYIAALAHYVWEP